MILLDTDTCVEILHGNLNVLRKRKEESDSVAISFVTVAELFYGAAKSNQVDHNDQLVTEFLLTINIIQSDIEIARAYGELNAGLERTGLPIADADLFIAATTITKCNKLIT
jgi:tRNA(fMet)-specific endonuclease VapC